MIEVNELSLFKGQKCLLSEISLRVQPGQKLAILGANGAGKSTLLKCLAGEESGYQGKITLGRHDIRRLSGAERARCLAVMPQQATLAFPFRVEQVVALGRTPWQDESRTLEWQQQAMQLTDCAHLVGRTFTELSGGEQQRVQLARVLVQLWHRLGANPENSNGLSALSSPGYSSFSGSDPQPAALLLDECTSALDPAHQHSIMQATERFAVAGVAVVAVMHDTALAASWADRILVLKQGEALAEGAADLLARPDLLVEAYQLEAALAQRYANSNRMWL